MRNSHLDGGISAVRLVLLLWGGLDLVLGPLRLPGDGDLYWQRWLGEIILHTRHMPTALGNETFTAVGAPWVTQEWLFSIAVAAATNYHAFFLLAIVISCIPGAILVSIYLRSQGKCSLEAIAIAMLFSGVAFNEAFGIRAQVLGWAALAAFMLFLERRDRLYYAVVPTAVAWANLHASVMIAPAIMLARVAGAFVDGGFRALRSNRDTYVLPAVLLATFCTPLGWRLPFFAITFARSPIRGFIQEWQPPGLNDLAFVLGALPLAVAIVAGGRATLINEKKQSFPAALLFVSMLLASRNIPLFAIVAAPLAAVGLSVRLPQLRKYGARLRELEPFGLVATSAAILLSAISLVLSQRLEGPRLPIAAVASVAYDGGRHKLFCENFTWCSMALEDPRLRVFIDGRCDAYPIAIWQKYVSSIRVERRWARTLDEYGVDAIIAQRASRFEIALANASHWRRTFEDASYAVFRRDPSNLAKPPR